jgi:hypothetical protein
MVAPLIAVVFWCGAVAIAHDQPADEQAWPCREDVFGRAPVRPTLRPRNEAAKDPHFEAFLRDVRSAVARRDGAAILRIADPGIKLDFGGTEGIQYLKKTIDDNDEEFWRELGTALDIGGTFREPDSFSTPYVYSEWPDALDAFSCLAVTATGVRLREKPNATSAIVARLDYDIVEELQDRERIEEWRHVRLWNGQQGYVASQFVRSPIGYRAWFQRTKDGWRLMAFLAGD